MKKVLMRGLVAITSLLCVTSHADTDIPRQLVEDASTKMTSRLIADREQVQSQDFYLEQLVDEIILPVVDHVTMSKRVLGKYWRRASNDQQKTFVTAFKQKVIRTYAGAFKAFNGETIQYEDSRINDKGNQALVKSQIVRIGAAPIRVDYKLYSRDGKWRVFDVVIEGVSLVKSFRDQVSLSIEQDGLAKAISKLADEYKSEAPQVKLGGHEWGPYLGKTQPNSGLAAAIVSAAFARAGYSATIEFMPWERVNSHIEQGSLDGSVASWYTAERADTLLYSEPYINNKLVFIKRDEDPFTFSSVVQAQQFLKNRSYRLGIFNDYAYGETFNRIRPLFQLETRDYCSQLFRDVAAKELDLALVDHWVAQQELANKDHIASHLITAPGTLSVRPLHIAIPKNHPNAASIIKAFNSGLKQIRNDGSYQALLEQFNYPG